MGQSSEAVGGPSPAKVEEAAAIASSIVTQARELASASPTPVAAAAKSLPKKRLNMTTMTTIVRLGTGLVADDEPSRTPCRTVGELRPKHGVVVTPFMSVAEAAKLLSAERQDACLVLSSTGAAVEDHLKVILFRVSCNIISTCQ